MSRVITFSRFFPKGHPKAGQPTYFVEGIFKCLYPNYTYFWVHCENCGWMGSSILLHGGGQIADTGDYGDTYCPKCDHTDPSEYDHDEDNPSMPLCGYYNHNPDILPKAHTIRAGNSWKVGDKFSPRVWGDNINEKSGRRGAYHSNQITIAPDIEIKKIYEIRYVGRLWWVNGQPAISDKIEMIAKNDGLEYDDFINWFDMHPKSAKNTFSGQILCFTDTTNY